MTYAKMRENLYGPIRSVFSWDWLEGEEYGLAGMHQISRDMRSELSLATAELGKIFARVTGKVQHGPDGLLRELGIPEEALAAVRIPVFEDTVTTIGRFDFAQTPTGPKMLEFNSDTPTSVVEAFFVNQKACDFFGVSNPNAGMETQIERAFQDTLARYRDLGYKTDKIVFSALGWHDEDRGTARFLLEKSGLEARFAPLEDLRVKNDRLWVVANDSMEPADVLYRLHALEKLADDRDDDGYPTGKHVLDLIARKKLAIINPPSAFVAQTKALQALVWGLHEAGEFFTPGEHELIERYMLPTYLENRFSGRSAYVVKPIFGREGGAVSLYAADDSVIEQDKDRFYWDQPMVYQQLVEMEQVTSETVSGPYQGRLLWGSFLVGGQASAICARIGGRITGNLSCYLPAAFG